jgi:molybdopterin converting factor small subunit
MPITIQLPKVLADLAGSRSIEANGATLGEAVDEVAGRFPAIASRLRDDRGEPYEYVVFYLNDEDIRLIGGFEASITDGDEVTIVPAVARG